MPEEQYAHQPIGPDSPRSWNKLARQYPDTIAAPLHPFIERQLAERGITSVNTAHHEQHTAMVGQLDPEVANLSVVAQDFGGEVLEIGRLAENASMTDAETLPPSASRFVENQLHKQEIEDTAGYRRTKYIVAGQTVLFRNRQEVVELPNASAAVLGAEVSPPLPIIGAKSIAVDTSITRDYIRNHEVVMAGDSEQSYIVTNTPAGMLAAAHSLAPERQLPFPPPTSERITAGDYTDPEALEYLDGILAAISVDDAGELREYYDIDGYAVVLAALTGDETAADIVDGKRTALRKHEAERRETISRKDAEWAAQLEAEGIKPIPIEQLALVHSTEHAVEYDDSGNVILYSAASKRADAYPRASLHFTVNSQVAPHAQAAEAWGADNTLIVANLAKTIQVTGRKPEVLYGVDSWFVNNPGDHVTMADAVLVRGVEAGELVQQSATEVNFLAKNQYSQAELDDISNLAAHAGIMVEANETPQFTLKEIALRRALITQGVPLELSDVPSGDGHGMTNTTLDWRLYLTGAQMGLRVGKHFDMFESIAEKAAYHAMNGEFVGHALTLADLTAGHATYAGLTSLEARRQIVASGCTPVRPNAVDPANDWPGLDVVF